MKFKIEENIKIFTGELLYFKKEYNFDFQPMQVANSTVLINNLNMSIDFNNCATQVWGYNSYLGWIETKLVLPNSKKGKLILVDELEDIERIEGSSDWSAHYDPISGWICIGNCKNYPDDKVVEFASATIAVINNIYELKALWLKPSFR